MIRHILTTSRTCSISRRTLSIFSGELALLYQEIAEQHRHKNGPWLKTLSEVKAALPSGRGRLLDLASGPGEPGLTIARSMPRVDVVITDIESDQVAIAAKSAYGLSNVSTMVASADDLSQFNDNSFDVITCCYGYMFVKDFQTAFNESYRVLRPGGSLVAIYWMHMPYMQLVAATMRGLLGDMDATPRPATNPLSLSEPGLVPTFLNCAGFSTENIRTEDLTYSYELGNRDDRIFTMATLPLYAKMCELKSLGKDLAIENGKIEFWKEFKAMEAAHRREDGTAVLEGMTFQVAVAKKL